MTITQAPIRTTDVIRCDIADELMRNGDTLAADLLEELDDWSGYLDSDRFYDMDEFDELMSSHMPSVLASMIFNGCDMCGGEFNPNHGYFTFNGYGNLVSAEWRNYSSLYCDKYLYDELLEYRGKLSTLDEWEEMAQLLDEYAEAKKFEEEGQKND